MMSLCLFSLIAILAFAFDSADANAESEITLKRKTCDQIKDCNKCLRRIDECTWFTATENPRCMSQDECSTMGSEDDCLTGDGNNRIDEYLCASTCSQRLSKFKDCAGCLNYDIFRDRLQSSNIRNSDCVWRVRKNEEPECVYHKWCDESENSKCIRGRTKRRNKQKCRIRPIDLCPKLKSCGRCLSGKFGKECAWKNDGENSSCMAEDKCEGDCTKGSEILSVKKTCKRLKRSHINDEIDFEKCSDLNGLCTDCLISGCNWNNYSKECVESCDTAPAYADCKGLSPSEPQGSVDTFNRSLLKFDGKASKMCYDFKLDQKNEELCNAAGEGGCDECVGTELYTAPGTIYLSPPTCKYFPKGNYCAPKDCDGTGCAQDTCDGVDPIFNPSPVLPPPDTVWPELKGEKSKFGEEYLNKKYGKGTLQIQVVREGDPISMDYRTNRVRLFVDNLEDKIIVRVPRIG